MKKLIIIGAGGYAKSVIDSLNTSLFHMIGFLDDIKEKNTYHLGYPVLGNSFDCLDSSQDYVFFVAIGHNGKRKLWYDKLKESHLCLINIIDESAIVSKYASVGEGCFIGKLAIINHGAEIGNNAIINTRALVEHGCKIGNHVNVSTNSTLNGDVVAKEGCFIGSGSIVNGQIEIGEWSLVGSGAIVIRNVLPNTTVVGCPAREIISKSCKYNKL